jgi:two-component system chemotaxis response regulator CheB
MGVRAINKMGGKVIVQDQKTSQFRGMPGAAEDTGTADLILQLEEIGPALCALVGPGCLA